MNEKELKKVMPVFPRKSAYSEKTNLVDREVYLPKTVKRNLETGSKAILVRPVLPRKIEEIEREIKSLNEIKDLIVKENIKPKTKIKN